METQKKKIISRREYEWLRTFESLEPHEQAKVDEYEKENIQVFPKNPAPEKKPEVKKILITKELIWKHFKNSFRLHTGKDFIETPDTIRNIAPIITYFAKDEGFFKCDNLVRKVGQTVLNPSFEKGLLIIGNYGNGKTSTMNAIQKMMLCYRIPGWFKSHKSHELVTIFEGLDTPESRAEYFKKFGEHRLYIDDVKKEKIASNFGKVDLIREILEKRYDNKAVTHLTCNYREGDATGNIEDALVEFGERYGGHLYDRIFEMFNIIEFKGRTFRT